MSGHVLGISSHFHDAAAALVGPDGRILAAAQEERFTRKKADWRFPTHAIRACLGALPDGAALGRVAYYEDPGHKVERILNTARALTPRGAALWPRMIETLRALHTELPEHVLEVAGAPDRIVFVQHHRSHAASAFYPAPFHEAAVLVMDGVGEYATTTLWRGDPGGLTLLDEIRFPHSLGLFYSAFTQYLGFKVNSGEYKLMGLAPFGMPTQVDTIRTHLIDLADDGSFTLDMDYFAFDRAFSTTSPLFERLFGAPQRAADAPITPFHMNLAASVQAVLEEAVLRLARRALAQAGSGNLCLAGGVALNCVANGRVAREVEGLRGLWVQPAAGDAGGALGAALDISPRPARPPGGDAMRGACLGPAFDDAEIAAALDAAGLVYEAVAEADYAETVAKALAEGQVVGHFNGPMEYGPRALGNRSILADPRGRATLSRVNRQIKFREDWRPFAPMVLEARAAEFFEAPTHSPYMLSVAYLKPAFRGPTDLAAARAAGLHTPMTLQNAVGSVFDAVTHVDFSARLQTIAPDGPSRAGAILAAFAAETGCPMLLNTSFNVRGEPIVCTPKHAIDCFLNTHLDLLAIGGYVLRKSAQPNWTRTKVGRTRFAAD